MTLAKSDHDAILLGAWGHRTLLIERPEADSRTMAESIPPSAQKVLAAIGVLTAIEDAGFLPWLGNIVWWGQDEARAESFAPGQSGYLVARRAFDRRLRGLAAFLTNLRPTRTRRFDPSGHSGVGGRTTAVHVR